MGLKVTISGGSWIITRIHRNRLDSGYNPNYGQPDLIDTYRSEIYASLAASILLHLYATYYMINV